MTSSRRARHEEIDDDDVVISFQHKSFPPHLWGTRVGALATSRPLLAEFTTPVLALDSARIDANLAVMQRWARARGLDLAPHGKTTMAPALWRRMLDHGAIAITLATPWQAQVARHAGIDSILLANVLVDPSGIRWIAAELDADPAFTFRSWVDSVAAVEALAAVRADAGARRPQEVLVELGAPGGRSGARSLSAALEVARAVVASPSLRLVGCGGYEGVLAHDRSEAGLAAVRSYLEHLAALHEELGDLDEVEETLVTAGGSAYVDVVADVLAPLASPSTRVVLRSGVYAVHDDGFYRGVSPLDGDAGADRDEDDADRLRSALHCYARVLSRPEPGLALLDAGRRDVSFDDGLPVPLAILGADAAKSSAALAGAEVTALNDQHAYLRFGPEGEQAIAVGAVLRLGLSHPCTAFDKWRLIPLVAAARDEPVVVGAVTTYF